MWIAEEDTYSHPAVSWMVWLSAILTSLFFSATSHILSRLIDRIYKQSVIEDEEQEASFYEQFDQPVE